MGTGKVGVIIDNRLYNTLAIATAFGAGSIKALKFYESIECSGSLDEQFGKMLEDPVFDAASRERIRTAASSKIESIIKDCKEYGILILPIYDIDYPYRLRHIPVPPMVLYVKGNLPYFDNEAALCIIGPRSISKFGYKAAFSLARRLSKAGMLIISGSAAGGDTAAHSGVCDGGGRSVMVTACGIITELKSKNHALCDKVLKNGCIISENTPRSGAGKYSYPVRNRLLSGLSLGVVIIEAPEKSGTLITAGHAVEQGRDVFVVPGGLADKHYKGSNSLLRDGAIPLIDTYDIFSRYVFDFPEKIDLEKAFSEDNNGGKKNSQKKLLSGLSNEAVLVYNNLVKPEFTIDDLSALDIEGAQLLSALTELELEHLVISLPGGVYKKSE